MSGVDIGFAEVCEEPWRLESRLFPSKVGGKPAWLDLEHIPTAQDLQCPLCERQMIFLCQVYAPYEEDDDNFHRTLFIFVCRNASCDERNKSHNFKVFRSHLRRDNMFYPAHAPREKPDTDFKLSNWLQLCKICGCEAKKVCSKCKAVFYCTREDQVLDWKEGEHKLLCGIVNSGNTLSKKLFPQLEVLMEVENIKEEEVDEQRELEKFTQLEKEGKTGTLQTISEEDLEAHVTVDKDETFTSFRKRISREPDQVLRYDRGGDPVWIAADPKPLNIPDCNYCGGPRQFEFQIMPQLLAVLEEQTLDWGVLLIYSCKSSCTARTGYKEEFIFKQDVSEIE